MRPLFLRVVPLSRHELTLRPHSRPAEPLGPARRRQPLDRSPRRPRRPRRLQALLRPRQHPPYPLTHALILLALYALCSAQDGPNRTFRTVLQRISAATAAVWTAQPVYDELRALDDDGEALSAFARERPQDKSKRASKILSSASSFLCRSCTWTLA